ncbi:MAG: class I SAM-dependent methyltransferase [Acidiferrobacterales bacterium]|nr:class I SAM-dependent methyltransferase [Acidiferrobacterales bacterium]
MNSSEFIVKRRKETWRERRAQSNHFGARARYTGNLMNLVDKKVDLYATAHSAQPSSLVQEIDDWTVANSDASRMLSGALQGAVLQLLARLVEARRILEIGMFTGYSALTMAEVLPNDGELITIDNDPEREAVARAFFAKSPHGAKITIRIGNALDVINDMHGPFDLVYIDADKSNYLNYYEAVLPLVRAGGVIVADNVLWSSAVLDPKTEDARSLHEFNQRLSADGRVMNVLLTVRDGLMVAQKISD